jgi:hypothetical protein
MNLMNLIKRTTVAFVILIGISGFWLYATAGERMPPLKDGDLIFQTSTSDQSAAILAASGSLYSHMGVIKQAPDGLKVIEAAATVRETPLSKWIARGLLRRVAVYRDPELTVSQAQKIIAESEALIGRSYNIFFSFETDAIYCSELPWIAYGKAGIALGKVEKISDLNVDNLLARRLIERRWRQHPACRARGLDLADCSRLILDQTLITPASIARDPKLTLVYSNYPL